MKKEYSYVSTINDLITDYPPDSIVSRTFFTGDTTRAVMFGFAPGQELSEHTSAKTAILHFIEGQALLTLGDQEYEAGPGTWVHMPPNLPHSINAKTQVSMLLLMY